MMKTYYADVLSKVLYEHLSHEKIVQLIETPKYETHGDLAFPCFELAKVLKKSPVQIANELVEQIHSDIFSKVEAVGPYVNVFLNRKEISIPIIEEILQKKEKYGSSIDGKGQTIVVDLSSPNIAKPFSMGHLRSTVIGNSICQIAQKVGYQTVGINHLGDWGTQFGKLMYAYLTWGDEAKVKASPIKELNKLYVYFHEMAQDNPALENEGRIWFKKLEEGDEEATRLWTWFREVSLKDFQRIYDLLDVQFDSYNGEAFFNDKMDDVVRLLEEKNLLIESDGAKVVDLSEYNLPPCLIKKSDGATLYATRDLAAAIYRQNTYHFSQAIYVVGGEQALHFQQFFHVLEKMGYDWVKGMKYVPFGLMMKDGKKMSTRKGKTILLEEVLQVAIGLSKKNIQEKNPDLSNADEVARQVGVGAVIFHDLKNERTNNCEFSLESMLKPEGETGPYIQYTHARACSILRKSPIALDKIHFNGLTDDYSWTIIKLLEQFPEIISRAFHRYEPSVISKYLLDLAQSFNKYYGQVRVLEVDEQIHSRLALLVAVVTVLAEGLRLLGIQAPQEM